jgi:cysteinyl-tRNA synthetase
MAAIWMHNEMLELGDEKMSKSIGNVALLRDVLDRWPAPVVIAFFLTSHYRSRLPFSEERMAEAEAVVARLGNALRATDRAIALGREGQDADLAAALVEGRSRFFAALSDDFGTPGAFAALFDLVRVVNRALSEGTAGARQLQEVRVQLGDMLDVLGLGEIGAAAPPEAEVPAEVLQLAQAREGARAERDFARADALRAAIRDHGFEVTDTPEGPRLDPA